MDNNDDSKTNIENVQKRIPHPTWRQKTRTQHYKNHQVLPLYNNNFSPRFFNNYPARPFFMHYSKK